jgi:hypothetical protein
VDYVIHAAVDDPGQPGVDANANGQVDPGETFQLTVDVTNTGNLLASNVRATIALLAAPLDTIVLDDQAAWPDVAVGATETSGAGPSPHFLLELPWSARCDEAIDVLLSGTYDGPSGAYPFEQVIRIPLGTVVENTVLADSFETADPADLDGWTHDTDCTGGGCDPQDDWQRGVPGGASTWDPAVAFDGSQIWANDLGGVIGGQPWDGNYRGGVDNWLESPPIDCSALRGTTLRFMRWLSVEDGAYDRAAIEVNGVEVWRNPVGADLIDTAWTPQEIDISAIADGNPDVRVRFTLTADGGLQYGGWAIDLFSVLSAESQCEPWCGAAATVPPRVGWTSLRARASGPAGVELLWSGETLAADEEFRLYRGTRPDQLDLLLTPPLHAATSWTDGAAPALGFYRATRAGCAGEAPLAPAP